jgi:hypothetical protein
VRIAFERRLHQQRQPVKALAHVGVAHRQPHPQSTRDRDNRRPASLASALMIAETVVESAAPAIRIRGLFANSTSLMLAAPASGTTAAGENAGVSRAGPHSCCHQRNTWLGQIPAARATSDVTAPGSIAAATIRRFSSAN